MARPKYKGGGGNPPAFPPGMPRTTLSGVNYTPTPQPATNTPPSRPIDNWQWAAGRGSGKFGQIRSGMVTSTTNLSAPQNLLVSSLRAQNADVLAGMTDQEVLDLYNEYLMGEGPLGYGIPNYKGAKGMTFLGKGQGRLAQRYQALAAKNNVTLTPFGTWVTNRQGGGPVGVQQAPTYGGGGVLVNQRY